MNSRTYSHGIIGAAAVLIAGLSVSPVNAARPFPKVTNVSTNPAGTNEFYLTATNMTVTNMGGTNVQVEVYIDDPPGGGGATPGLPSPMVAVNVGTMIICHFQNKLNSSNVEGASIHWHGIESANDSDGTPISQDSVFPGQTYVYKFIAPRPGLYWYHSHMIPGTTTFGGMYGPIIVTSNIETTLIASNILPSATYAFPLVLSDISFTNGVPGKVVDGTNYSMNTLFQLCENYALGLSTSGNQIFCGPGGLPGDTVLVNGYPPALVGTLANPSANSTPIYTIADHSRVRLQIFDVATSRDFYLSLRYPSGAPAADTNLYRVGGQGGLLDNALVDGGVQSGYNFLYNSGSIELGAAMRADVMFYPTGSNGEVVQLVGNPLPNPPWELSSGLPSNYPIAFFVITNTGTTNAPLAAGSPILAGTSSTNESLKTLDTNTLIAPPYPTLGHAPGGFFPAQNILLLNTVAENVDTNDYTPGGIPNIEFYAAGALDGNTGYGSWTNVPHPPSALWARVGDVLELAVINDVGGGTSVHPFHLHGFSMQPMYIYSANLETNLYTFDYNEFLDTYNVYPGQALVFRIHLTDRPKFGATATGGPITLGTAGPTGGAIGRWLMHCHIFLHATVGMITELNVVANTLNRVEGPAAGSDSVVLAGSEGVAWTATTNATWLHLSAANQAGTGSANVIFTYEANTGGTRTSSLNVAGETVNVTQAGSAYVQAPGPVTELVSSGIGSPTQVAVDGSGNVYFADSTSNVIRKWTAADNTVSTLIAGLNDPQDLVLDSFGDIYFSDYGNSSFSFWSVETHTLSVYSVSGMDQPEGLAVDSAGNVYIADPGKNTIWEYVPPGAGSSGTLVTNGLSSPYGVAVDLAGNVYIADTGNNAIKKWVATNNTVITLVSSNATTPLDHPWNLAVDGAGNVYIADGYDDAIKEWSVATGTLTTLVSGLGDPTGLAVDGYQNVYIADYNNKAVKELPYAFVDTSDIVVDGAAATYGVSVVVPATANLAAPFTSTSDASWVTITGASNGVVYFSITANAGGERLSTITVLGETIGVVQDGPSYALGTSALLVGPAAGSNSVVLAVVPSIATWTATTNATWLKLSAANQSGTGSTNVIFGYEANTGATRTGTLTIAGQTLTVTQAGSTYVQAPGPVTELVSSGLSDPVDVAVGSAGNVYISDGGNNAIKKWSVADNTVSTLVSSGLIAPQALKVDGAGNVYFADFGNNAIKEWTAADSNVTTIVSGLNGPTGVALDGMGNVYIADPDLAVIEEWTAANSNLTTLISSGLFTPYGVSLDAAGNVYIADTYSNAIREWIAANNTLITLISSNSTTPLNTPWNVKVDGAGNVYIADGEDNAIKKWSVANKTLTTLVSGLGNPTGVGVDDSQNVYIADFGNNVIRELPYAYVDPTAITEGKAAGSDVLPTVLSASENLLAPFAPTSSQSWLTISGITGGVVSFNFTANTATSNRTADITLLGQAIPITQAGVVPPPKLIDAKILTNGVFQFGLTNANPDASFTVLSSTNLDVALTNWTVIGTASNISSGVWQFTDTTKATNKARFYIIRSP